MNMDFYAEKITSDFIEAVLNIFFIAGTTKLKHKKQYFRNTF
jgi:hypothetical protein